MKIDGDNNKLFFRRLIQNILFQTVNFVESIDVFHLTLVLVIYCNKTVADFCFGQQKVLFSNIRH